MTQRTTLASLGFRIPRRSGDGQGVGARAPHRGQLGRFQLENLSIVLWEDRRAMPRQRTDHSRIVYVLPDDFPQRLVRFREVSRMPWAEIARRLGAGSKTVGRWHKDGVRPNAHYLLAPRDLAKGRRPGHLFTVRATPYQTVESEGRGDSGQGPADCTTGGEQKAGRPGHSQEGLRLPPGRTSDAMPRARAHHSIGEAAMSPGRCKASSHTRTRGNRRRAVRSNPLSTRRRGSGGGSPIASLPDTSHSLTRRLWGCE